MYQSLFIQKKLKTISV